MQGTCQAKEGKSGRKDSIAGFVFECSFFFLVSSLSGFFSVLDELPRVCSYPLFFGGLVCLGIGCFVALVMA